MENDRAWKLAQLASILMVGEVIGKWTDLPWRDLWQKGLPVGKFDYIYGARSILDAAETVVANEVAAAKE